MPLALFVAILQVVATFVPAQRSGGPLPPLPANATGWTDATFELSVDATGAVQDVMPIAVTPGSTAFIGPALKKWTFQPAGDGTNPLPSRVLVVTVFRPPILYNGPALGAPPNTVNPASPGVPLPLTRTSPQYPMSAIDDAIVLMEISIDTDGSVLAVAAQAGSPPFSTLAVQAVRQWTFQPAQRGGIPVKSKAYVIVGFARPVT